MLFDKETMFSDAQAITADAASENVIDLGATGTPFGSSVALVRDVGRGYCCPVSVLVGEAFNNLTSLQVTLQVSTDEAFTSPKEVASKTYALADLATGQLSFPDGLIEGTDERYVRLFFDVTGTAPTTGQITAGVVAGRQTNF